ncbi:hypothetical protein KY290_008168 [Solanum tuberosum]|uniref:Retrotransposon Copia-like N-terminal domain-containing protein n=1 Tax=Solanum tuberosum TaxID=4113 RepID=A0ABQ7W7P4_SOLTU|nr:hypothetical protein KY290_008168 [Solanum tuberosum]
MAIDGETADLGQNSSGTTVPSQVSSVQGQGIDYNHPLFLNPTDVNDLSIISFQLLGIENYTLWSRSIKLALLGRNKIDLIDGTARKEIFGEEM